MLLSSRLPAILPGLVLCHCVQSADSSVPGAQPAAPSVASGSPASTAPVTRSVIDEAIARHTLAFIRLQPQLATKLALDEGSAGGPYNDRLPDYSPTGMQAVQTSMRHGVDELTTLDPTGLPIDDARHLDIVRRIEAYYAGSSAFPAGFIDTWGGHLPYVVSQIGGPLQEVPDVMQTQQRVASIADAEAYVARLQAFPAFTAGVLAKVQADEAAGIVLPQKLFPKTLLFLDRFVEPPAAQHGLVRALADKLDAIAGLPATERTRLVSAAIAAVSEQVYPSYREVREIMAAQQSRGRPGDGIWDQPGGAAFYQHELISLADTSHSPDEVHAIGLREVARISAEMNNILAANGLAEGSVAKRMAALGEDKRFLYPDNDAGRSALLTDLGTEIDTILQKAPALFATLPKAGVEVKRIPLATEASAPGGYYSPPSLDGSRPGVFWINLREMDANPKFGLKTLTYHEAVPGHHFQIALNMEQTNIGLLRKQASFNAYTEGWALYSELVAKEIGMYEGDPWGDLGRLQAELYRSVRLVVDTGLHAKHWTRERAIAYFLEATGSPESDVVAEVERYMAWPGQALGYKLGMIEIVALRDRARAQLGPDFDVRSFHDLILLPGARPMSTLRSDVERWIDERKAPATG